MGKMKTKEIIEFIEGHGLTPAPILEATQENFSFVDDPIPYSRKPVDPINGKPYQYTLEELLSAEKMIRRSNAQLIIHTDQISMVSNRFQIHAEVPFPRKTFVEGRPAVRQFDLSLPGRVVTGSRKVFIDGRPAVRMKDKVICGRIVSCSSKVFYG